MTGSVRLFTDISDNVSSAVVQGPYPAYAQTVICTGTIGSGTKIDVHLSADGTNYVSVYQFSAMGAYLIPFKWNYMKLVITSESGATIQAWLM